MKRDIAGMTFGRLTAIEATCLRCASREIRWLCVCKCGRMAKIRGADLIAGKTLSCGCLRDEKSRARAIARNTTHGKTHTPEYRVWSAMLKRCRDPKCDSYKAYGGRGITVCERWSRSFQHFLDDMGPRPSPKHSIDRQDNGLGYSPDNCRWATAIEQQGNRKNTRFATIDGCKKPVTQWCRELNLNYNTVAQRLWRGWTAETAILTPLPERTQEPVAI